MRLNFILVILIIAALGASGFFIINYFRDSTSADNLEKQIETTNAAVQEITAANETLAAEIDNLKITQEAIKAALSTESLTPIDKPDSTEVIRSVMNLGIKYQMTVIPLSTSDWSNVKVQQSSYQVFKMNFKIQGTEKQLIDFVRELPVLYPVLVIESFSIGSTSSGATSGGTSTPPAGSQFNSNLSIAVYAR